MITRERRGYYTDKVTIFAVGNKTANLQDRTYTQVATNVACRIFRHERMDSLALTGRPDVNSADIDFTPAALKGIALDDGWLLIETTGGRAASNYGLCWIIMGQPTVTPSVRRRANEFVMALASQIKTPKGVAL